MGAGVGGAGAGGGWRNDSGQTAHQDVNLDERSLRDADGQLAEVPALHAALLAPVIVEPGNLRGADDGGSEKEGEFRVDGKGPAAAGWRGEGRW